jgi:hypothetical protein
MQPMHSIHRLRPLAAFACAAAALAAAPLGAQSASPFQTRTCPLPAEVAGYPVWVKAADGAALDSAWTLAAADVVARRWEPPSRRRVRLAGLNRLQSRVLPPEPRWPDDWTPSASHVARVEVTLHRGARAGDAAIAVPSGDRAFDHTLPELFRNPAPGSPDLPELPAGLDSVRLAVGFGLAPEAGAQAVRFAAQQTPLTVVPGTLNVARPTDPQRAGPPLPVTVKYDVDTEGRVIPRSIEVLEGGDRSMNASVQAGLLRARFSVAQSNCRPVTLSVVQQFGGR